LNFFKVFIFLGVSALANPSLGYDQGLVSVSFVFGIILAMPIIYFIILPFFFQWKLTTSYEYLEIRFDERISKIAALGFVVKSVLYLALILYAPSLVLSTIFGLKIWISILSCGLFATVTFYLPKYFER
jgi:Na+/proline symporter